MTKEIMHNIYEMNQEELREYILGILKEKNIQHTVHDGNIYSFRFKDKVAFVSHMDTVAKSDEEYHKPVFECCGILFKRNAILGADDRAGINIILNHIDDINFVITRDEEIGRLGAISLKNNTEFVNAINEYNIIGFIEMDRKNNKDILGKKHGYCNADFHDVIFNVLNDREDAVGSCTDIDSFIDIRPAVNLSCGYHSPHSSDEFLDIKSWLNLNNKIDELNSISGNFTIPEKKSKITYYTGYTKNKKYNNYSLYDYDYGFYKVDYSELRTHQINSVEDDLHFSEVEWGKNIKNENYNYGEPDIVDTETIINLIKDSTMYCQCSVCGKTIAKNERYHVINGYFVHDKCLSTIEKNEFGIIYDEKEVNDDNKTDK